MGGDVTTNPNKAHGIFYLETTDSSPFVIPNIDSFSEIEMVTDLDGDEEMTLFESPCFELCATILVVLAFIYLIYLMIKVFISNSHNVAAVY